MQINLNDKGEKEDIRRIVRGLAQCGCATTRRCVLAIALWSSAARPRNSQWWPVCGKLLVILNAILRDHTPWNPNYQLEHNTVAEPVPITHCWPGLTRVIHKTRSSWGTDRCPEWTP